MTVHDSGLDPQIAARLKRNAEGLVCAVVQQHDTGVWSSCWWQVLQALVRSAYTGTPTCFTGRDLPAVVLEGTR